ncbi:MAG: hypothetical protein KF858_17040 [Candidatus Sumerlaeia bacterium]|nr:hypothetical protein [Candidatus Sumerlaeia bacterium]
MPYRMRYFDTTPEPLALQDIEKALVCVDPEYRLDVVEGSKTPLANLCRGDDIFAQIEINQPGDGLFEPEIQEMLDFLADSEGEGRERVEAVLKAATHTIALALVWQERETDETLSGIDPLWEWLFQNRRGLLQADGEGYYDETGLILEET